MEFLCRCVDDIIIVTSLVLRTQSVRGFCQAVFFYNSPSVKLHCELLFNKQTCLNIKH